MGCLSFIMADGFPIVTHFDSLGTVSHASWASTIGTPVWCRKLTCVLFSYKELHCKVVLEVVSCSHVPIISIFILWFA